ncbi:MAG: TolC family protein, partial [Burkholderiales bacterium]
MFRFSLVVAGAWSLALGAQAQVLSLEDALRAGEQQSPRLAAQRFALTAVEQQVGRAAELPDPRLRFGIENLPITTSDRFRYSRDFMTMRSIGVMQDFPNEAKRAARDARAQRARDVEQVGLAAQRATVQRDIALAWFDVHFAERTRGALESLVLQFAAQADTAPSGVARGRQTAADGFMLRGAVEQARDRVIEQQRMVRRARIALAAWLGDEAKRPLGALPDTSRLLHSRDTLLAQLLEHPMLRMLDERERLARADTELARTTKKSDWSVEFGYAQREPYFSNMITVMVALDLPWQAERRQDRDIASKLAEAEQVRAQREDARRVHEAEVRGWLADHDTAAQRIERYHRVLLPLARDRVQAALAAYQGGRGELAVVLEANRAITET